MMIETEKKLRSELAESQATIANMGVENIRIGTVLSDRDLEVRSLQNQIEKIRGQSSS